MPIIPFFKSFLQSRNLLFDNNPHISLLFNDRQKIVDANESAVRCFGFKSKRELIKGFIPLLTACIPPYQSTGRESISLSQRLASAVTDGYHAFNTDLIIDGQMRPFNVVFKCISYKKTYRIAAYLSERRDDIERMRHMLEATPFAGVFMDIKTYATIDCNMEAVRLAGFSSKEAFIKRYAEIIPECQPDGTDSWTKLKAVIDEACITGRAVSDFMYKLLSGEDLPVEITVIYEKWRDSYILSGFARDLRKLKSAENVLNMQAHLLQAVNDTAVELVQSNPGTFDKAVEKSLKTIGQAARVDRVYIWENFEQNGKLYCRQLYEWSEEAEAQQGKDFTISFDYDETPVWKEKLLSFQTINSPVKDLPGDEQGILIAQGIRSILMIPITILGEAWGFIGFDDCQKERTFDKTSENVLQSGGILIATSILRNSMTEKLIEARTSALASAKAKSDFLSHMSHEIRTPMNAIIGMTSLAQKCHDMKKIKRYLETVDSSSRQLLDIINDVLDMTKIDANKLEIQLNEVSFEALVKHVFHVICVKAEEKKIDLRLDFPQVFFRNIISDELRLSQVLINLLSNAVKFTPDYGVITLKVRNNPIDEDHSVLRMEVIDNGIGIAADKAHYLFNAFAQADDSITRQYGGTGLGLAICKRIIDRMGGGIWVESEPGCGSRFIVELPVAWGGKCAALLDKSALRSDLRILVADDDPETLAYFTDVFAGFSLTCDTAASGEEAIALTEDRLMKARPYHIVFLDMYMPGLNGTETAREIKNIMQGDIEVIIISAAYWSEIEQNGDFLGTQHFLHKPVMASDLYNAIAGLAGKSLIPETPEQSEALYDWSGECILLADDIALNRDIIAAILEETGITIDNAENGREVVDRYTAAPDKYKLILMDVQMPLVDGLTATRQIRASGVSGAEAIPIIAMTANAFKEDVQASLDAGMNRHLSKPIEMNDLYKVLMEVLKR